MSRRVRKDKFIFSPEDIEKIEHLAALGLSIKQISGVFGVSSDTLYRRCNEGNIDLSAAIEKGRGLAVANVAAKAYQLALDGNTSMIKYVLSCKGGWSDKSQINEDDEVIEYKVKDKEEPIMRLDIDALSYEQLVKLEEYIEFRQSLPFKEISYEEFIEPYEPDEDSLVRERLK